jgi:hypothetical protein
MNKRGRTKLFVIVGISLAILLISGLIAAADNSRISSEVEQVVEDKKDKEISQDIQEYVEEFVEKKEIASEDINNITQINFEDLPKEVAIENVDDTNLAIYQINYNKTSKIQDNLFVITYSVEKLESQGDLIVSQDKREFLNFGFNEESSESEFLRSATEVETSLEKGYVMMRSGSITGISTNLEILSGEGNIEIVIYKNGEPIQFGNTFVVSTSGIEKDYDVQSKDTVVFEAGDIISAYVKVSDGVLWKDATTLVEIIS